MSTEHPYEIFHGLVIPKSWYCILIASSKSIQGGCRLFFLLLGAIGSIFYDTGGSPRGQSLPWFACEAPVYTKELVPWHLS